MWLLESREAGEGVQQDGLQLLDRERFLQRRQVGGMRFPGFIARRLERIGDDMEGAAAFFDNIGFHSVTSRVRMDSPAAQ